MVRRHGAILNGQSPSRKHERDPIRLKQVLKVDADEDKVGGDELIDLLFQRWHFR
jgi:hypothetical protein